MLDLSLASSCDAHRALPSLAGRTNLTLQVWDGYDYVGNSSIFSYLNDDYTDQFPHYFILP